jgi:hypothetical protein
MSQTRIARFANVSEVDKYLFKTFLHSEDHWNLYMDYITSVFRLTDSGSSEITVKTALDFVDEQQKKFPKNRGPFLAQIEVQTRLLARSGSSDGSGELEHQVTV